MQALNLTIPSSDSLAPLAVYRLYTLGSVEEHGLSLALHRYETDFMIRGTEPRHDSAVKDALFGNHNVDASSRFATSVCQGFLQRGAKMLFQNDVKGQESLPSLLSEDRMQTLKAMDELASCEGEDALFVSSGLRASQEAGEPESFWAELLHTTLVSQKDVLSNKKGLAFHANVSDGEDFAAQGQAPQDKQTDASRKGVTDWCEDQQLILDLADVGSNGVQVGEHELLVANMDWLRGIVHTMCCQLALTVRALICTYKK